MYTQIDTQYVAYIYEISFACANIVCLHNVGVEGRSTTRNTKGDWGSEGEWEGLFTPHSGGEKQSTANDNRVYWGSSE